MKIDLNKPKEVTIVEKKVETITSITIDRLVDLPSQKIVRCFISELREPLILWEGDAYDQIGQWTDKMVVKRIQELFELN